MSQTVKNNRKDHHKNDFTIVGIGASAGGLAALKTFFSLVPEDSGLAFVVVVHLSPDHKSALAELLQPHLKIPIEQVSETMKLEPNRVYVIPPNANLNAVDTHLRLSKMEEKRRERAPIDHFFRTMAKTHDGHSIGIILTGTGSDGALGIKEIKIKNGLTIVQDPHEAEYDGMPQSAIATGIVDVVLPLAEIPPYIINFATTRPKLKMLEADQENDGEEHKLMQKVYAQVRARTGRDFSRYKLSTIMRRLQRRMQLNQLEKLEDYLELLRKNAEEVRGLSDDFLINVTSFFRDAPVYQEMEEKIIPRLFERKKNNEPIRIWSVGCATGEEAYSLTMLLMEEAHRRQVPGSFQVFASDLHEHSLRKAREGFYPGDIEVDVNTERLHRFFTKENGGYRVRKELREQVVFTPHNLLGDPPFSRIDLVVCRNLLIYLKRNSQRDIFALFHYSLRPDGFLLLGPSEHLDSSELFRTDNKDICIYAKRNVSTPEPRLPVFPKVQMRFPETKTIEKKQNIQSYGVLHQKTVERYAPPSLLLSMDHQVLHVSETAGRYLRVSGGEPTRNVFKLIRPEILAELRNAVLAARERKQLVRSRPLPISLEGEPRQLIVSARVVYDPSEENSILLMFEELDDEPTVADSMEPSHGASQAELSALEKEIQEGQQRLQAVIEDYETSQEEMKASNEELQSANEELRSTLEELETSKEELQSVNEELTTVNQENRHKVEELGQLSDDLQNLMAATDIATLFLNKELRIMRFTPKLEELFNVRPADRGRLISDQTHKLSYDNLVQDAQQVLKKLVPIEREIQDKKQRTYLTRLLPYRSSEDRIDGVVITFIDITARKESEEALRQSEARLSALVHATSHTLYRMSPDWTKMLEVEGQEFLADIKKPTTDWQTVYILPEDQAMVNASVQEAMQNKTLFELEHRIIRKDGSVGWVFSRAVPLLDEKGNIVEWFGAASDVSDRKEAEEALQEAKEQAEKAARAKEEFLSTMSHEIRTPLNAIIGLSSLLLRKNPRPDQEENLSTLKFSSHSLLNLINDILDYSKLEAGKVELENVDYRLSTLIRSIQQAHQPMAEERGNALQFQVAEGVPDVLRNDPHKLAQILNNLVSNANKFTENGSISLEVSLNKQDERYVWLHFAVRDTGTGISEEKLQAIFEKFTQADSSTARRYGGTGLGLSITKSLLQLMGSDIEVKSKEGEGAVFYFTLKEEKSSEENLIQEERAKQIQQEQTYQMKSGLRILLVDDAAINRMVLQQHLEEWCGVTADEAANGREAVELARQKKYDLILMDIRMPEMDGLEASRLIRQLDAHYAQVPIIALTADTSLVNTEEGAQNLFNGVVTKPFGPEQLKDSLAPYVLAEKEAQAERSPVAAAQEKPATSGIYQPDFDKVEDTFGELEEKKQDFYTKAITALQTYQTDYLQALEQGDAPRLENTMHKARSLFHLLGLEDFYQQMLEVRQQVESGTSTEKLAKEISEIQQGLAQTISAIEAKL